MREMIIPSKTRSEDRMWNIVKCENKMAKWNEGSTWMDHEDHKLRKALFWGSPCIVHQASGQKLVMLALQGLLRLVIKGEQPHATKKDNIAWLVRVGVVEYTWISCIFNSMVLLKIT